MRSAYVSGLRRALRQWPIALVLFAVSLLSGLVFTAATWSWLAIALDKSLATRTLLTDLDMNVFVDLFVHHGESLRMLLVGAGSLLAIFSLLWVGLNAVAVVAAGEDVALSESVRQGVALYPRFLRLWFLALLVNGAAVVGAVLLGWVLTRWTAESAHEASFYWAIGASGAIGAIALLFCTTVHDHARVHSVATGDGAARAYAWALGFVSRREWRALPLAALLVASSLVVWVVYQTVGMRIPTSSTVGVAASLIWGETLLLARMLMRLWFFAAETELQNAHENEQG
jgi:hypothetical protein